MPNSIDAYIESLKNLQNLASRVKQSIIDINQAMRQNPGNAGLNTRLDVELAKAREIVAAYRTIQAEQARIFGGRPTGTTVPGGATTGLAGAAAPVSVAGANLNSIDAELRRSVQNAMNALRATGKSIQNIVPLEKTAEGLNRVKISAKTMGTDSMPQDYKFFVDSMGNYGRTLRELRRNIIINDPVNRRLFEEAGKMGFAPTDLRSIQAQGQGAYKRARFQQERGGVQYTQDLNVDKAGGIGLAPAARQYQSFAQSVGRDIRELLKWSIAISVIYGPINALSGAVAELIENQAKLADVSIAVNDAVADTGDIFEDVYKSAQTAGESVGGVIDAFGQAYRAAGSVNNQFDRYNVAVDLLNDSLVLSKLSTLDQAGAIDTLTAALSQSGSSQDSSSEKLRRGTELLDLWVRTSQVANVDIATLATGVAVLGDTAETAGLSLEQLNALVATIAETSLASGKEAANIAKALVGNYQSDTAVKELNRIGIAVVDTTGKNRQFLDVMKDIAALRSQGILGDQDFSRLTLALGGGGIRRQADVARFIENFGRMQQIVELQSDSSGEASQALAKKLDTVQTSATRLGNSFTELAQSLGSEGGLLSVFAGAIDLSTGLVEVLDSILSKVGKAGPLLIALGVGAALWGRGGVGQFRGMVGQNIAFPLAGLLGGSNNQLRRSEGITNFLTGGSMAGRAGLGALGVGITAGQNFASGDTTEAGANIAGGIVGFLVSGGNPIGAIIGAAIAESFVRTTLTYESDFRDLFAGTIPIPGADVLGAAPEDLNSEVFKSIGGGYVALGKFRALLAQLRSRNTQGGGGPGSAGITGEVPGSFATPGSAALEIIKRTNPELYKKLLSEMSAGGALPAGQVTPLTQRQIAISRSPGTQDYLRNLQQGEQDRLRTQLITGDIKPADYANRTASLSAFSVTATRYMAALVDETNKLPDGFDSASDAYQTFLTISSSGNQELIDQLNSQIAAIDYYQNLLKNWQMGTPIKNMLTGTEFTPTGIGEIESLLDTTMKTFAGTAQFGAQQIRLQNLKIPDVYGGNVTPTPIADVELVKKEAIRLQDRKYADLARDDYDALKESYEIFAQLVEDSGNIFYEKITGIDKSIYGEAFQSLQAQGKISAPGSDLGFQSMDITRPQLEQAVQRANTLGTELQKKFGYTPKFEDVIIATSDEQISKQHTDMRLLQYILQQILDTEKKQLEGMYNIPEGATVMVPLTAAWYANRPYGGATGGGGMQDFLKDPSIVGGGAPSLTGPGSAYFNSEKFGTSYALRRVREDENRRASLAGYTGIGLDVVGGRAGVLGLGSASKLGQDMNAAPVSKFDIRITSTTQLVVDGRVLASIVKPFLAADLERANTSGGTVTKTFVI